MDSKEKISKNSYSYFLNLCFFLFCKSYYHLFQFYILCFYVSNTKENCIKMRTKKNI